MFTGTLIEDLIATVERAEQAAESNRVLVTDSLVADSWFASVHENSDYEFKVLDVA